VCVCSTSCKNKYLLGLSGAAVHVLPRCATRDGYQCCTLSQPWVGRSSVLWMMMQVPGCGEAAIAEPLAGTVIRFCSCSGRLFPPASLARKHCCHAYKECHSRPPAYACQMGDKHGGHILAFKWRGGHSRRAAHMLQMSCAFIRVACEGRGDLGPHAGCMTHIATSASIHLGPPHGFRLSHFGLRGKLPPRETAGRISGLPYASLHLAFSHVPHAWACSTLLRGGRHHVL